MPAASHAIDMLTAVSEAKAPKPTTAPPPPPVSVIAVLDPKSLYETFLNGAVYSANLPAKRQMLLGFCTGGFMALCNQFMVSILADGAPDTEPIGPVKMLAGACFSLAFMLIYIMGTEIFSGNILLIVAVLSKKISILKLLRNWCIIWLFNFLGCILFAFIFYPTGINGYAPTHVRATVAFATTTRAPTTTLFPITTATPAPTLHVHTPSYTVTGERLCLINIAKTTGETPYEVLVRAIFANICVIFAMALMVASRDVTGKIMGSLFPISCFIVIGGEHVVSNMYLFSIGTLLDCPVANHGWYWLNIFLSTIGNIIGASILGVGFWVAFLYHPELVGKVLSQADKPVTEPKELTGSIRVEPGQERQRLTGISEPIQTSSITSIERTTSFTEKDINRRRLEEQQRSQQEHQQRRGSGVFAPPAVHQVDTTTTAAAAAQAPPAPNP